MNELKIFNYEEKEVRTVQKDGETWWVLKDICSALGISNPTIVADRLDNDEKDIFKTNSDLVLNVPNRGVTIVNESGLYNVIIRSDKPGAKSFKRWITHEVLPSIRKNGMYAADELLDNPDGSVRITKTVMVTGKGQQYFINKFLGLGA